MSLFRWFIVRQFRRERLRSSVTVVGVAIGIAVVVAIRLANESSLRGFTVALDAVSGRVSLEVTTPGLGVDETRLADLSWLREYGRVSPVIDGDAAVRSLLRQDTPVEIVRVLGVDILRDRPFREYHLVNRSDAERSLPTTTEEFLSLLTDSRAVVMPQAFVDRHGLAVGNEVQLLVGDRTVPLVIRGVLGDTGPAQLPAGNFALMDIAAAQLALGRLGVVDRIDIQLHDAQEIDRIEREVADRLPLGLTVQRPARRGAQVETMLAAFHFNLTALSYIALLVGLFLVYNTVTVAVITRRAEIGMLRTVGATRWTILALFLGEAVCLAIVGCLIGAPLGWVLAHGAVRLTASTVSMFWVVAAATVPPLGAADIVLSLVVGVPLSLAAAGVPAYEAARLMPIAAVRSDRALSVRDQLPTRFLVGAVALFVAAGVLALQPPVSGLPVFGLVAALATVFGAALLVPFALAILQRFRGPVDHWLGIEVTLARANLAAAVRRISVSVAALVVSLAMMVAIAIMIGSFRETVTYWIGQTLQADLFVSSARQSPIADRNGVPIEVENGIRAYPGVEAVDGFRAVDIPYGESLVIVGSGRFDVLLAHGNLLFKAPVDGRAAMAEAVDEQAVVVSESFSLRYNVDVGDQVELMTSRGPQPFEVSAVYFDYSSDRGILMMDEPLFDRFFDSRRPSGLTVYLGEGVDPNDAREGILASLGPTGRVFIDTNRSLRGQVIDVFDSTFAITYALEAIAIFVSMFGVAATLLTLALERRQDIAMLRLVGAERHHLRRMIMVEAGLIGVVSLAIGVVVGFLLSLILIFVINVQSFGWTIQFHVPGLFLLQACLLILAATAVAGLYPARLASTYTMADLREE